jgi:hypothetical protein
MLIEEMFSALRPGMLVLADRHVYSFHCWPQGRRRPVLARHSRGVPQHRYHVVHDLDRHLGMEGRLKIIALSHQETDSSTLPAARI